MIKKSELFGKLEALRNQYCETNPKRIELISELYREFSHFNEPEVPRSSVIKIHGHYSHRLLKKVLRPLGFRIFPLKAQHKDVKNQVHEYVIVVQR